MGEAVERTWSEEEVAIHAEGVVHSYDGERALDGVDLTVRRGEVYGLLGPNGAGKTTLVRCLTGSLAPDGGVVEVLGRPARHADRTRVGLLPQDYAPHERLTASELVEYYAGLYPRERSRDVDGLLAEVGLEARRDTAYGNLSGGQKRRLLVAAAVVNDPDVLFLDEPTTGIDPVGRREVWRSLLALSRSGTAVLLTTHYMEEAERLADRVGLMHAGRVVEEGSPEALVERHTRGASLELQVDDVDAAAAVLGERETAVDDGVVVSDVGLREVGSVLDRLASEDVEVEAVNWRRPSLDDVYVSLTGEGL